MAEILVRHFQPLSRLRTCPDVEKTAYCNNVVLQLRRIGGADRRGSLPRFRPPCKFLSPMFPRVPLELKLSPCANSPTRTLVTFSQFVAPTPAPTVLAGSYVCTSLKRTGMAPLVTSSDAKPYSSCIRSMPSTTGSRANVPLSSKRRRHNVLIGLPLSTMPPCRLRRSAYCNSGRNKFQSDTEKYTNRLDWHDRDSRNNPHREASHMFPSKDL